MDKNIILVISDKNDAKILTENLKNQYDILNTNEINTIQNPDKEKIFLVLLDTDLNQDHNIYNQIINDKILKEVSIIFISNLDEIKKDRYLKLDDLKYLIKPIDTNLLIKKINDLKLSKEILHGLAINKINELELSKLEIIHKLAKVAEFRDNEASLHVIRMSYYAKLIAEQLGDFDFANLLYQATPMHDIGKIAIPDGILLKPAKLTEMEFDIIKEHTIIGAEILAEDTSDLMILAKEIILYHHEKFDGTGYPKGLKGEEIPLSARIAAIADVFDALTSVRPYKKAWDNQKAIDYINDESGKHFDPKLVKIFNDILPEIIKFKESHQEDISELSFLEKIAH